jgi:hypothetical protein
MARQTFQKSQVQRHGSSDESFYLRLFKPTVDKSRSSFPGTAAAVTLDLDSWFKETALAGFRGAVSSRSSPHESCTAGDGKSWFKNTRVEKHP